MFARIFVAFYRKMQHTTLSPAEALAFCLPVISDDGRPVPDFDDYDEDEEWVVVTTFPKDE